MFGDFCSAEIGPGHDKAQRRTHRRTCAGQAVMVTLLNFTRGRPPRAHPLQAVILSLVGRPGVGCGTSTSVSHRGWETWSSASDCASPTAIGPASPRGCPRSFDGLISALLVLLLCKSTSRKTLDSGTAFPSIITDSLFICFLGFTFLIQLSPALQMFFPQLLTPSCRAVSIHLGSTMKRCAQPGLHQLSAGEPAPGAAPCLLSPLLCQTDGTAVRGGSTLGFHH